MKPEEVFRLEREDGNEWIPPHEAAEAIRQATAAERDYRARVLESYADAIAEIEPDMAGIMRKDAEIVRNPNKLPFLPEGKVRELVKIADEGRCPTAEEMHSILGK